MIFNQTGGGGSPELQTKTVGPSTSQQLIVPDTGFDGLSQVTVTPALLETKSVTPSTSQQTITPSSGYYGMGQVNVGAVRLEKKNTHIGYNLQHIMPSTGYIGMSEVTATLDSSFVALSEFSPSSDDSDIIYTDEKWVLRAHYDQVDILKFSNLVNSFFAALSVESSGSYNLYILGNQTVYGTSSATGEIYAKACSLHFGESMEFLVKVSLQVFQSAGYYEVTIVPVRVYRGDIIQQSWSDVDAVFSPTSITRIHPISGGVYTGFSQACSVTIGIANS